MLLNFSTFGVRGIEVSWARPLFIVKLYLGFVTAIQQHVYTCVHASAFMHSEIAMYCARL